VDFDLIYSRDDLGDLENSLGLEHVEVGKT